MNILQILPELNVGGVETGTVDLAKYLVDHGHKSVVVSAGGSLVADLEKSGSIHYTLPVSKKNFFTMFKSIKKLAAIIEKGEKFESMVEKMNSVTVSDPLVAGSSFCITMHLDAVMKERGQMDMTELCVYKVKDGKIISEEFIM